MRDEHVTAWTRPREYMEQGRLRSSTKSAVGSPFSIQTHMLLMQADDAASACESAIPLEFPQTVALHRCIPSIAFVVCRGCLSGEDIDGAGFESMARGRLDKSRCLGWMKAMF